MSETNETNTNSAEESIARNKRTADRQITKDDDPEGDGKGDEQDTVDGKFRKADASVLEKRRIVKAKRPTGIIPSNDDSNNTTSEASKSSNPFAKTTLVAAQPSPSTAGFGSAATQFKGFDTTAAAAATSKEGAFGSSTTGGSGFGSSTVTGGFGSAAAQFKGFGTTITSTGGGFGAKKDGDQAGVTTKNLFEPSSTVPSFGFGMATNTTSTATASPFVDAVKEGENNEKPVSAETMTTAAPTVQLPDSKDVHITTGEEDEKVLFEERAKAYKYVVDEEPKEQPLRTQQAAAPCVAPSSTSIGSKEKAGPDAAAGGDGAKNTKENRDDDGDDDKNKDKEVASTKSSANKRWQELGVGPLKLLMKKNEDGKLRLVQRYQGKNPGDKPTRVLLNEYLYSEASVSQTSDKSVQVQMPRAGVYSFKFKTEESTTKFVKLMKDQIEHHTKSCVAGSSKDKAEPKNSDEE